MPYKYYKLLDYFILFSKDEPFGNVIIENLYVGNKVLTFKNNIYYDHKNTLLSDVYFEYEGEINLNNAITHILNTATSKKTINTKNTGKKYVIKKFSKYSKKFLSVLFKNLRRNIDNTTERRSLNVKCEDGFANQVRLTLAGNYLVKNKYIESYHQQWCLNNHNNVNFSDFFKKITNINLDALNLSSNENVINTSSFEKMIHTFVNTSPNFQEVYDESFKDLSPLEYVENLIKDFCLIHPLHKALGLHVRKTCKDAFLKNMSVKKFTEKKILKECNNFPLIFLATDNKETQDFFKQKLQDKLIVYQDISTGREHFNGDFSREKVCRYTNSLHTIMDLFLLLKCDTFLGSHYSSFSHLVKSWRNNSKDFKLGGKF
jgi:hypothetical protein